MNTDGLFTPILQAEHLTMASLALSLHFMLSLLQMEHGLYISFKSWTMWKKFSVLEYSFCNKVTVTQHT